MKRRRSCNVRRPASDPLLLQAIRLEADRRGDDPPLFLPPQGFRLRTEDRRSSRRPEQSPPGSQTPASAYGRSAFLITTFRSLSAAHLQLWLVSWTN
jgi:hypothetical protein